MQAGFETLLVIISLLLCANQNFKAFHKFRVLIPYVEVEAKKLKITQRKTKHFTARHSFIKVAFLILGSFEACFAVLNWPEVRAIFSQ